MLGPHCCRIGQAQEPELRVLAVDLPGRGDKPADLATVSVEDWVNSAVADIDDAGLGDVVVVGHSMAGLTVPGVVAKLGVAVGVRDDPAVGLRSAARAGRWWTLLRWALSATASLGAPVAKDLPNAFCSSTFRLLQRDDA